MFAIVRTGGKQYRVAAGDKIVVDKIDGDAGATVRLGDVLLAGDGGDLTSASGLEVSAEIVAQAKGEKIIVFKKRRRHNYRRKNGHRQQHTILKFVSVGGEKAAKQEAKAKPVAKDEPVETKEVKTTPAETTPVKEAKPAAAKPKANVEKTEAKSAPKARKVAETDTTAVQAEPVKKAATKKAPAAKPAKPKE